MHSWMRLKLPRMGIIFSVAIAVSGCSILFPDRTAPKSGDYSVTSPGGPWEKVAVGESSAATDSLKADHAYENPESGAIISINSICRKYAGATLDSLTNNLVRGIGEKKLVNQTRRTLDGAEAQDSIFQGVVDNVAVKIRTVVLKKDECTYDFLYVTIPERERDNGVAFENFVASFRTD